MEYMLGLSWDDAVSRLTGPRKPSWSVRRPAKYPENHSMLCLRKFWSPKFTRLPSCTLHSYITLYIYISVMVKTWLLVSQSLGNGRPETIRKSGRLWASIETRTSSLFAYTHYTLYATHYTIYTIYYVLYTIYYILYTIYYIITIYYILYTIYIIPIPLKKPLHMIFMTSLGVFFPKSTLRCIPLPCTSGFPTTKGPLDGSRRWDGVPNGIYASTFMGYL
jgi:hypothetical protein